MSIGVPIDLSNIGKKTGGSPREGTRTSQPTRLNRQPGRLMAVDLAGSMSLRRRTANVSLITTLVYKADTLINDLLKLPDCRSFPALERWVGVITPSPAAPGQVP